MKRMLLILLLLPVFLFADMKFSDPQPSVENPRKWVIRIHSNNLETINHTLDSINNVLKEYPPETIKIAVVAYSKGMRVIRKDGDKKTISRIKALMDYDVEFVACKNTMETMKWKESEFIDGLTFVQAGIAEALERVVGGWIEMSSY